MAYYDTIAKQWHQATGYQGGAFKERVLNKVLLDHIGHIADRAILELGAGNGYFMPLVLRRFSGQVPAELVITDGSSRLLDIAKKQFRLQDAVYQTLDVGDPFPFDADHFDLILATMLFNEVSARDFDHALRGCRRVLVPGGTLLMTVTHPDFVANLQARDQIAEHRDGKLVMPGAGQLKLPVILRTAEEYRQALAECGFTFSEQSLFPTEEVLNAKAGLRHARGVPLALVFDCQAQ